MTHSARSQRGAALATAMIFLIVLTLLGLSAMRSGRTALLLADNEQSRVEALAKAQAGGDAVLDDPVNLNLATVVGTGNCYIAVDNADGHAPTAHDFSCAGNEDSLLNGLAADYRYARTERLAPETLPIRRGMNTSALQYSGALFAVTAGYDSREAGHSAAEITEGVVRLVPQGQGIYRAGN